jgi:hypothetical protein
MHQIVCTFWRVVILRKPISGSWGGRGKGAEGVELGRVYKIGREKRKKEGRMPPIGLPSRGAETEAFQQKYKFTSSS